MIGIYELIKKVKQDMIDSMLSMRYRSFREVVLTDEVADVKRIE